MPAVEVAMVTYRRIRRENLKLSSAGTPSARRWLSPIFKCRPRITQRALQRATWHGVGTWRFSRLRIAPHLVTRLLQFSVSLFPTPRYFTRVASPRAEDMVINWMELLEDVPCGYAVPRSTGLNLEAEMWTWYR